MSQDEWNAKKQQIQDDYEAEVGALTGKPPAHFDYSKPAAVPAAATPSGAPQNKAPQSKPLRTKLLIRGLAN